MDFQTLLITIIALVIIEFASDLWKKVPFWLIKRCAGSFQQLWQESKYLLSIIDDKKSRFAQWNPEAGQYVALHVKVESANQKVPELVLDSLESFLGSGQPVVLLGEPGAGKTTVLKALTYRLAWRAYWFNVRLRLGLLLVAALLLLVAPLLSLVWLASFFLWESFARRAIVPIFLEARSYSGDIEEWCKLDKRLGEKPLFRSHHRVIFLVDGVNEVKADLYSTFREIWRTYLKNQRYVVFTSRIDEDPTLRLGLEESNNLILCHLDDEGVREFLQVMAARKGKPNPTEQTAHDFAELQNKKLLGEKSIGRNPYWLEMMVESGLYTRNRGALFHSFAKELIEREIEKKPEERKRKPDWKEIVPLEIEMDALVGLALAMHQEQSIGFRGEAGWQKAQMAIKERLGDEPYSPNDVLAEAEAATLVRTRYKEHIEFTHQLLQEFFAAYALRSEEKWDEALQHCEDPWWWETLLLLGNLLEASGSDDASATWAKFTRRVLGDGQNDWRLFLAIGLVRSATAPGEDIRRTVEEMRRILLNTLEVSIGEELTETQVRAITLGEEVAEVFAPLLERYQNSHTRKKGIVLLRTVGGRRAAELLLSTLYTPDLHEIGAAALIAIGEPAIAPLIAVVIDIINIEPKSAIGTSWNHAEVFERAVRALAQIGTPAIESLVAVLRGEVEIIRYAGKLAARTYREIIGRPTELVGQLVCLSPFFNHL